MKKILVFSICSAFSFLSVADDAGNKIVSDAEALRRGYGGTVSTIEMINDDGHGATSSFTINISAKEYPGDQNRSVMRFIKPAEDSGTVFMVHSKDGPDDQWIFLPKQNRTKKISGTLKNSAFLGSEFTFSDLSDSKTSDYINQYSGEKNIDGFDCFIVEKTPVDKSDDYLKIITYIEKTRMLTIRSEYFNKRGELIKTASLLNYTKGEDGRWRPEVVVMKSAVNGKSTTFKTIGLKINDNIPDSNFNISAISSGGG